MGVRNLWKLLNNYSTPHVPFNKKIAIDASIWLHYYKNIPHDLFIYYSLRRIFKILHDGNKAIFIFDTGIPLKKKTVIEERKRIDVGSLARKVINKAICKVCKVPFSKCLHATVEKKEIITRIDEEVTRNINENRTKNWGMYFDDEVRILDSEDFKDMSKQKKLNILIGLRERRKMPSLNMNDQGLGFSIDQINNVRKRNRVTEMIKELEENNERRVMSDCSKVYVFKDKATSNAKYKRYNSLENTLKNDETDDEESSIVDLENVFNDVNDKTTLNIMDKNSVADHLNTSDKERTDFISESQGNLFTENDLAEISSSDIEESLNEYSSTESIEIGNCKSMKTISNFKDDSYIESINTSKLNIMDSHKDNIKDIHPEDKPMGKNLSDLNNSSNNNNMSPINQEPISDNTITPSSSSIISKNTIPKINSSILQSNIINNSSVNIAKDKIIISDEIPENITNSVITTDRENKNNKLTQNDLFMANLQKIDNNKISDDIFKLTGKLKDILRVFNIPFMDAPLEADSQCAVLSSLNLVDTIITEDNDVLLFGGTSVYKNYFRKNQPIQNVKLKDILNDFSVEDLINLSYYLGSDYTLGVKGIGLEKAKALIKSEVIDNIEIQCLKKIYLEPVVKKINEIDWGELKLEDIRKYICEHIKVEKQRRELLFYVSKLKK